MNKALRYISISHKTASVSHREVYHIFDDEKVDLAGLIRHTFPDIAGLFILSTCNRTELYFESEITIATVLRDFFIAYKAIKKHKTNKELFDYGDATNDTIRHLLEVSSGLSSSVLGDAEIINQIKKAFQFSMTNKLQGSLLERAMQTVFKAHKRISNETQFRDGTTSVAYKTLKVVNDTFTKDASKSKKILFIGTGEIVMQLFKYNSKFNFDTIYIANRTKERAIKVSREYHCKMYAWDKVLRNDFEDFDVIISAASNCHHLIKKIKSTSQKLLLIDLALPGNINSKLAMEKRILFHDLDTISIDMEDTKEKRLAAVVEVDVIIKQELQAFIEWHKGAPLRTVLAEYKTLIDQKLRDCFEASNDQVDLQKIKIVTNQIIKKIIPYEKRPFTAKEMDALIAEHASLL